MPGQTIKTIQAGLQEKTFSAKEVTQECLQNIRAKDGEIHAFLDVYEKEALENAEKVDQAIASGEVVTPLMGVPIALKDNLLLTGKRATASSKILENYVAPYDSFVVKKLKKAGVTFLGKTNLDEFAMGSSTENSAFGATKNPHDLTLVPGGSSGGSAAAVAAEMAVAALGSDTGGSIRQPAHFCGVVGLKPTYGSVSRSGLIALASSLDQIGPMTKTVADAALVFDVISGKDPYDNTSKQLPNAQQIASETSARGRTMTIGLPKEYFEEKSSPEVEKALQEVITQYKSLGVQFKEINLPHTSYGLACYYIIQPAEASSNLARFDGLRYSKVEGANLNGSDLEKLYQKNRTLGLGEETKRRIMLGTFVLSSGYYDAYYKKAQEVRAYIKEDFRKAFTDVDLILTPTAPTPAFKIGEKIADPLSMYLSDIFAVPTSLAGLPAISIPARVAKGALPVGFQLIAKPWHEADLISAGKLYEEQ